MNDNDKKLAKTIGDAARRARAARNLTQAEAAQHVGIVKEVYSRLERGHMLPSVPTLVRLCAALRVKPNVLLGLGRFADTTPGPALDVPEKEAGEVGEAAETVRLFTRVAGRMARLPHLQLVHVLKVNRSLLALLRTNGEKPRPS